MKVCIDRAVVGMAEHLVVTDRDRVWSPEIPEDAWSLTGACKNVELCMDSLLKLNGRSVDLEPPARFVNALQSVAPGLTPPWRHVMPQREHDLFLERVAADVRACISTLDTTYMLSNAWAAGNKVLRSLRPCMIDRPTLFSIVARNEGNVPAVRTFKPDNACFAKQVVYNRFGTRTGRLTVASGPHILTLRKDHRRSLLTSRHEGGRIVEIDISALEPRVMLVKAGRPNADPNLYESLNEKLFSGECSRNLVKGSVISQIYGMSKASLKEKLSLTDDEVDRFVDAVSQHFDTANTCKQVKEEFLKKGYITNAFGRRVEIDVPIDRMFVNSFAQSTGADVAMLCFEQLIDRFASMDVTPVYVIADAILFDVHPDHLVAVQAVKSIDVANSTYPVKVTVYERSGDYVK